MKKEEIVNVEKALAEKTQMQKIFIRENGYSSSVLTLLIEYWVGRKEK